MRTTLNIDDPILKEVKALQRKEGKALGQVVSELLAFALKARRAHGVAEEPFRWISRDMGARYDPADRDAILDAMERDDPDRKPPR